MGTLRLTADTSQLVSEVKKAKEALNSAKSEYKAAAAEAELLGTKEGQLVNKIKAANQMQATRTAALQTYERAIHQIKTEIDQWEKEEQELIQKLKEAQKANDTAKVNEYTAAIEKLRKQIKDNSKELTTTTKAYNDLRTDMAKTEKQTKELTEELEDLSNVVEEVETVSDDAGDSFEDFEEGADGAGTAVFSLQSALSTASGMLRDFGEMLDGITNKFEDLIKNGIEATATALVNLGKFSLDKGMSFEESMSSVMATMGLNTASAEYEKLKETAEYYGRTTKYTATEAAQGLNILAQSGLSAEQQIATLPNVLNLASAGALDLNTAAKYITGSVKGFGDSMENAAMYTDLMAKGASLANTDTNMLGAAFSGAAANANSYGQTAQGLTLSLLRLAEQNVIGTDASTALNRAMMDLYTPTDAAAKVLDKLGVSAYDDTGKARDFNTVIDELNTVLSTMNDEQQNTYKNAIFSTYGLNAFNKMTVTSTEKVNEFKDALSGAGGAAEDMAKTMIDNLQGDLYAVQSAAEGFGIKIFEGIVPGLRKAVQGVTSYISELTNNFKNNGIGAAIEKISKSFSNFATQIPSMLEKHTPTLINIFNSVVDILAIVIDSLPTLIDTALPNLMSIIESLASKLPSFLEQVMPTLIDGIGWLASNFPILITGLYGLQGAASAGAGLLDIGGIIAGIAMAAKMAGTSLSSIASAAAPVLGVIAAVAAAIAAVVGIIATAYVTSENFRNYCSTVLGSLKEQFGELTTLITDSVIHIMQMMGLEVNSATDALGVIMKAIEVVATVLVFLISQSVSSIVTYVEVLVSLFMGSYEVLSNLISAAMALLSGNFKIAGEYIDNLGKSISTCFSNTWKTVRDSCSDFGKDFGDFMGQLHRIVGNNPLEVMITSDLDVESFKQDMRLVASWGLPGLDESKFGPLFRNQYTDNSKKPNTENLVAKISKDINIASASVNNWNSTSPVFNNNYINNNNNFTWNTDTAGDENAWVKMQRETEVRVKYGAI